MFNVGDIVRCVDPKYSLVSIGDMAEVVEVPSRIGSLCITVKFLDGVSAGREFHWFPRRFELESAGDELPPLSLSSLFGG